MNIPIMANDSLMEIVFLIFAKSMSHFVHNPWEFIAKMLWPSVNINRAIDMYVIKYEWGILNKR